MPPQNITTFTTKGSKITIMFRVFRQINQSSMANLYINLNLYFVLINYYKHWIQEILFNIFIKLIYQGLRSIQGAYIFNSKNFRFSIKIK